MKIGTVIGTPDLITIPLGLAWGSDLEASLRAVAEMGFEGVELMLRDPAGLDSRAIQQYLRRYGLDLVELCSGHVYGEDGLGLIGPDEEICRQGMERMKAIVDFAAEFGPGTKVNIGRSRGRADESDLETSWVRLTEALQELADHAGPKGVKLLLEPINRGEVNLLFTTQEGIRMCRDVNRPNFGLLLDVYHMHWEGENLEKSLRQARDYLWLIHFSDSNRKWPGNADIDFPHIVEVLNELGYEGYVSFEAYPLPDAATAGRLSLEYLRRYIPTLRQPASTQQATT